MKILLINITILLVWNFFLLSPGGVNGLEAAEEIIYVSSGSDNPNPLLNLTTRFKRINRTHQMMIGQIAYEQEYNDDTFVKMDIYRQDHGGWHPLVQRQFFKACSESYLTTGLGYGWSQLLLWSVPPKCPVKRGTYNLTRIMPRYRKEWPLATQRLIPPFVTSADKYKIVFNISDTNTNDHLATLRFEYRLINRFSSQ